MNSKNVLKELEAEVFGGVPVHFPPALDFLPARMVSAGYEYRDTLAYDWDGAKRGGLGFVLFQLTLSGEGYLEFEGKKYLLKRGDLMLIPLPHAHHRYRYVPPPPSDRHSGNDHWRFCFCGLEGAVPREMAQRLLRKRGPVIPIELNARPAQCMFSLARDALQRQTPDWQMASLIYQFVLSLGNQLDGMPASGREPAAVAVQVAQTWGSAHLGSVIGVSDLAEACGLSRYHFSRVFREQTGQSPGQWLQRQRLQKASSQLLTSPVPIQEIGRSCGFPDANYFARAFRKQFGLSPQQYRREGWAG